MPTTELTREQLYKLDAHARRLKSLREEAEALELQAWEAVHEAVTTDCRTDEEREEAMDAFYFEVEAFEAGTHA